MARVKICGITTPDALEAASAADWVGFMFVAASPRHISPMDAASLSRDGPAGPRRVGVFVRPTDAEIAAVLDVVTLSVLQLYDTPQRRMQIARRFGIEVWQAVGIGGAGDLPTSDGPQPGRYLLDAAPPAGAAIPGGNALTFDWTMLRDWAAPAPWLLAGGLTPGNVANAIAASGAEAVDVSSGVERSRGVKDPDAIRAFIAAAHGIDRA